MEGFLKFHLNCCLCIYSRYLYLASSYRCELFLPSSRNIVNKFEEDCHFLYHSTEEMIQHQTCSDKIKVSKRLLNICSKGQSINTIIELELTRKSSLQSLFSFFVQHVIRRKVLRSSQYFNIMVWTEAEILQVSKKDFFFFFTKVYVFKCHRYVMFSHLLTDIYLYSVKNFTFLNFYLCLFHFFC